MKKRKNIILLGKGSLAIKIAKWFMDNHNLLAIVPDIPEPTWTSSLAEWAKDNSIPIISSGDYRDLGDTLQIDLAMSVFYGSIINKEFISRCGSIINLHNAPLPKYRGVRPINWALLNEEQEHGVTIHKIHEGIDDGDILGRVTYPIYPEIEEVEDVYNKALDYGWLLFTDIASKLDYALDNAKPQPKNYTYYSNKQNHLLGNRGDFRR
jgi:methionyl-tRNA formyltransferase